MNKIAPRTVVRSLAFALALALVPALSASASSIPAPTGTVAGSAAVAAANTYAPAAARRVLACEPLPGVSGVAMFGDSMTVYDTAYLRAHGKKHWYIDALGGRGVNELPARVDRYLASHTSPPRIAIIALGTNERAGWTKASYEAVVAKFPSRTRIVFVNTYRPYHASTGYTYSLWMSQIAAARPRTEVANWRGIASTNKKKYLRDQLHPTAKYGIPAWSNRVMAAALRVEEEGDVADQKVIAARKAGTCA